MHCCVPFCKSTAEVVSESTGITFHEFPREVHLRSAWLKALGTQDNLPDSAVVCSQHFLNDDISETESGSRQIRSGAIPSTVQVCTICLDTQSKLYPMSRYKLDEVYQHLVGQPLCDLGNLNQTLCVQCAQRLVNFNKFRDKSLRARSLMLELVEKHELITIQHMDIFNEMNTQLKHNIVLTVLKPDHCDLYINTDKQTYVLSNVKPVVKSEVSEIRHESMSVDEDVTEHNVVVGNKNTENSLNINLVVTKEEYVSDEELKQTTDPLFVMPSTSKDDDDVPLAQIKYEITFECSVCSEEFADEESYNYHMSAHMEENQNLAEDNAECGQPSVSPSSFATKRKQSYMNKALYVEISPVETIAPVARKVLRKFKKCKKKSVNSEINDGNERYICNICHAKFKHKFSLHRHMRTHADEYPYTCQFCDYKCTVRYSLDTHMRNHTGDKPFICETCKSRFARNFDLVKHMKTHTSEKPHTCEVCEFKFKRKSGLIEHMKTHSDDKPYSCELCEYKAVRNSDLVRHMKSHTGDKPFACDLCEYKCIRRCNLSNHMMTHTGDKPFICEICKFRFARNFELVKHMKTHTSEKPHACEVCEFKFKRKSGLIEHMKTHSDDKPYSCELCEYKAVRNSDLVRHMKSHTGDKPFACDLCEYKCIRRCNLAHHMMTHTGDKPFICEICGLKCSSKANLRRHMFTHTGNYSRALE